MPFDIRDALPVGVCPVCKAALCSRDVKLYLFNCPHCGTALVPCRGRAYFWFRLLFIFGGAIAWAWHRWHDSFGFFAIGFYMFPLLVVWLEIERLYFPLRKFERPRSPFITLGI